jgi:amino acid adenylation domain-containing protein
VVEQWNATARAFPSKQCIHQLFEAQVAKTPGAPALVHQGRKLTYAELNARANQLAYELRDRGVEPDDRVAICVERGIEMVVALLAVLKAGGAYVPLDPHYPSERLSFMLDDSAPRILLTQRHLPMRAAVVIDLSCENPSWARRPESNPDRAGLTPDHLAYVIYTSGSTGAPKGVMIEHRGLCNLVTAQIEAFGVEPDSRVLQFASFSFDACTSEVFMAICRGAALHLPPRASVLAGAELIRIVAKENITHATLPPAVLGALPEDARLAPLQTLILAGDSVSETLARRWAPRCRLINAYGPTEATVCASLHECERNEASTPPIGRPIANTRIYVLDEHGEPAPIGTVGELYVGGIGVARGYLNRPALTAERFVRDPFGAAPDARMYKTGDLGKWLPDGTIAFVGRNDFQVKVRGFRIELGEIEAQLARQTEVREAVVLAREDAPGEKRLVAYYTAGTPLPIDALRAHLLRSLPEHMIPAAYVQLEAWPLTPNGKIDRKVLPAPDVDAYGSRAYEAPQGKVETVLARLWSEALGVENVGRQDNFFALGGHSLLAVTLIERMRQLGLQADVQALFTSPTLAAFAAAMRNGTVLVPPNLIPSPCVALTPAMLPLVSLSATDLERIVAEVQGGAANVQDIYPLAPLQEGILFHHLMAQVGDTYLAETLLSFDTRAHLDRYLSALQAVMDRHDILRTAVLWEGLPQPVQVVLRRAQLPVEEVIVGADDNDAAAVMYERYNPRHHRIDLTRAPLLRVFIGYDANRERWLLSLLIHHLALDHTTIEVMQEEIAAHLSGQQERLLPPLPFRNFVAQARLGVSQAEHEAFFKTLLWDVAEPTAPFGLLDVQGDGSGIEEARLMLDAELARRLRQGARRLGVSTASLCHLAWAQVLARVSGRADVVFGTVLFGRMQGGAGADRVMGPFINTLPVRIDVGEETAEASVRRTHRLLAELLRHEHASLALAQRCSAVAAPAPLFSSLLNYVHNTKPSVASQAAWQGIQTLFTEERTNYPLVVTIDDFGVDFSMTAQAPAAIDPQRVCRFLQTALQQLVEALANQPTVPLSALDVLPDAERRQVLEQWNATDIELPRAPCIHESFAAQVARAPHAIALVQDDRQLTYGELDARANQLAHHLRAIGVGPDDRVAICLEREFEMLVGVLAVLKAGAAYVPLDPSQPAERLRFMISDSAPKVVLARSAVAKLVSHQTVLDFSLENPEWNRHPRTSLDRARLTAHDLAYVIYTSGSTGNPKGVAVEHFSLANLIRWHISTFALRPGDRASSVAGLGFDATAWEIWPTLCAGATLVLPPRATAANPEALLDWWAKEALDVSFLPTPMAELAIARARFNPRLRTLLVGGDRLRPLSVEALPFSLVNNYGPTETTVVATSGRVEPADGSPHIGRPIANTRVYILDRDGRPAPVGVCGELYIGGSGVARGYWNRPALTAERFVRDPFVARADARMYKTGDLGQWLPDGTIAFVGRNDSQVKVRGFRIELGEIEAQLARLTGVREVVVVAREDVASDKRLVAYYTAGAPLEAMALRAQLSQSLPDYMIPAAYVQLKTLPLTPNGKIDHKALPPPAADAYESRGYELPRGELETELARLFCEVLGVERVGRQDNFFALGGHSLLAVTLIERMRQRGLPANVRALFATPELAAFAASLETPGRAVAVPPRAIPSPCAQITPEMLPLVALSATDIERIVKKVPGGAGNVQDIYPLGPLQEGILFHHLLASGGDTYLLTRLWSFDTRARLDSYVSALRAVIDRHDILRTSFVWEALPQPVQVVWRRAPLPVEEVTLVQDDAVAEMYERYDPRHYRIDLTQAPLLRVFVAHDPRGERWLLSLVHHHLVLDHTTLEVLQKEVEAHLLGRGDSLPAPLPFRDFVAQARLGVSAAEHETFFRALLSGVTEPTAPFGLLDVHGDGGGIEEAELMVETELARRLRQQARALGVSAASLCHLAWAQVLARVSGRDDVVFGTVLFGRMQGGAGADCVMGPFINTLPVRIHVGEETAEVSARRTHVLLAELLRHEHASLALAQRCSAVTAPTPLFSSLLNYRHSTGMERGAPAQAAWQGITVLRQEERTNYPLGLSVDDFGVGFRLSAQAQAPVEPLRVCRVMHRALEQLVDALENERDSPLDTLDVLPEAERREVVEQWNATEAAFPREQCLQQLFEAQVVKAPHAIALVHGERQHTYAELDARANRLAQQLQALGVRVGERVVTMVERSFELVAAELAILKCGAAYVPIDPTFPDERKAFMIADCEARFLLVKQQSREPAYAGVRRVDIDGAISCDGGRDSVSVSLSSDRAAYVMYTSGSTGQPKGVVVPHRAVSRLVINNGFAPLDANSRVAFASNPAFDASTMEVWGPLLNGGRIVIVDQQALLDVCSLAQLLSDQRVDVLLMTAGLFSQYAEALSAALGKLRYLILGGDVLDPTAVARLQRRSVPKHLLNGYGPTEATTLALTHEIDGAVDGRRSVPLGRPNANTRVYVLDAKGRPTPIGVCGEIHIGGDGVALGYLNRPAITTERFVRDPFVARSDARMYKTGDLGRWLPDGTIEFLGRTDSQVKIRGFRIELGEIETQLATYPGVREAVLIAREDAPGEKRLIAYYTASAALEGLALRAHLSRRLPEYMVPATYVQLEELPLTAYGKVDRKALAAAAPETATKRAYEVPQGEIETALAGIWSQLLKVERVGRQDDFFALGGHSLLAVQLASRLGDVLGVEVSIGDVFANPVLSGLAEKIVEAQLEQFEIEELEALVRQ